MKGKAILFLIICFIIVSPIAVYADTGPKDSLAVYVKNPPSELYYLDLLTQESSPYDNINGNYNQRMIDLLYSFESEGWLPALAYGTGIPLYGDLIGEKSGNLMVHKFDYVGVPETYRIIIVTESGNVAMSDTYTREALQSSITYDYATGEVSVLPTTLTYLIQFLITCSVTLILEGIVLLFFGISLKENWEVFIFVNIATQILLTLTVAVTLFGTGVFFAYLIQVPAEIVIIAVEAMLYKRFLTGVSNRRKVGYAVAANLTSWLVGFIIMSYFMPGI